MIRVPIGQGAAPAAILAPYATRHGLIAGATGTGKTYTLATIAEGFSRVGVPVFLVDVKGDLAGLALDGRGAAAPVQFFDVFGELGAPLRASVRAVGADLLARILGLTDVQSDILGAMFASYGGPLDSLDDLARALKAPHRGYQATSASLDAIRRGLIRFRGDGADSFLGSPVFDVGALERRDAAGRGFVSILAAEKLIRSPDVYGAALLWLLGEIYRRAPELGDVAAPRLVVIFDEAHLMFSDAPAVLIQRVERMVRLIRSKGVGVFLATQSPSDIPPAIAAQLSNRVQHAMRAATGADRREIVAAADCLAINPKINAARQIANMATGCALVSILDERGAPSPVDDVRIDAPAGRMGPLSAAERAPFIPGQVAAGAPRRARSGHGAAYLAGLAMLGAVGVGVYEAPRVALALGCIAVIGALAGLARRA